MEARFYRPQRNFQHFPNLLIWKLVKIGEQQDFPQVGGHPLHGFLDLLLQFPALHRLIRQGFGALHEIDEFPAFFIPPIDRRLQRIGRPSRLRADQIARLVRRDREKPRPEPPLRIKLRRALVHLQKGFLENIFRARPVSEEAHQEVEQFALISFQEFGERRAISLEIFREQLFIGDFPRRGRKRDIRRLRQRRGFDPGSAGSLAGAISFAMMNHYAHPLAPCSKPKQGGTRQQKNSDKAPGCTVLKRIVLNCRKPICRNDRPARPEAPCVAHCRSLPIHIICHAVATVAKKVGFFGLLPLELDAILQDWGWPAFRAKQVRQWVYEKNINDAQQMTNLASVDRYKLAENIELGVGEILRHQTSSDGTQKILAGWDGAAAEAVIIPDGPRITACISSQVGCPVGCKFCASGMEGLKSSLPADRIVQQIFLLNRILAPEKKRINHIVFMGMGEPLANYNNVLKAVRILHDPECFNLGARKITISTVGVPARMRQLAEEKLPLNLAISLHAPDEKLRRQLIPWAEHFSLPDILDAARYYFDQTGREITLEYILLSGVNDLPIHARQLAKICKTVRANVNLIRYNEVEGLPFERPESSAVVQFQSILRKAGVNAHVRKSRGRDIDAACGQLRRKTESGLGTVEVP
jgi:23S rRNA (adenine2503-C2)-methyltransferase